MYKRDPDPPDFHYTFYGNQQLLELKFGLTSHQESDLDLMLPTEYFLLSSIPFPASANCSGLGPLRVIFDSTSVQVANKVLLK
jgi:hypothetical protein